MTYKVTIDFLEDGQYQVQAEGDPYPLGIYNETGYLLDSMLLEARDAIMRDLERRLLS